MALRDNILSGLKALRSEDFVAEYFFDRVPFVFQNDRRKYITWKATLAKSLEVDAACVTIVGSSALGISMNPSKAHTDFNETSDIDVAVISGYHFDVAWRYLRNNNRRRWKVDRKTRVAWDEHVNRYIYWGTVATDKLLGVLPYGVQWLSATTSMAKIDPTVGREINLRIYADYDALRSYQISSIRRAQQELIS
jgi:hypothetical protein